jgi:hypothetical protein
MPVRHQPMLPIGRVAISVAPPNSGELRNAANGLPVCDQPRLRPAHGAHLTAQYIPNS